MLKPSIKNLLFSLPLLTALLAGCGSISISTAQEATAQVEAAIAQTIAAQATQTPTLEPTSTPSATVTPTATITETPSLTPIVPTSVTNNFCDNSAFVADVTIPDGTILARGQVFEKTWTFQNTGTCTWKPGYTIVFVTGNLMQGNTREIGQTVAPQGQANVSVRLFAPNTPGEYSGVWRLANGRGELFGEFVSVEIVVAGEGTPIPTP
ncbi:MAG: NBR1-Ig-like domain-containing protein [Anaerolineales bacterium]|jgi:hypothetical protein|nr:NBR1-Ig-like domain-containing protein [Anaerolineales bacterium]